MKESDAALDLESLPPGVACALAGSGSAGRGARRRCNSGGLKGLVFSLAGSSANPYPLPQPLPAPPPQDARGGGVPALRCSMQCELFHLCSTLLCTPLYGVFRHPKGQSTQRLYDQRVARAVILRPRAEGARRAWEDLCGSGGRQARLRLRPR